MKIPFIDFHAQYGSIKNEIDEAIANTFDEAYFVHGKAVGVFESEYAKYIGTKFCLGLNSGTDALILGIRAMNFQKGDEIIVPANTFAATALAVTENDLNLVFVDCNENFGIDLKDLKKKITNKTKAVFVVHLYGQSDDMDGIAQVIKESGKPIQIVEDACQAHGATYKDKNVGSFGTFAAFSFYPGKNLGAYGDGGAITTNNEDLYKKYALLREYGQVKKYHHETSGVNSRLDTLQAAFLLKKLKHLDEWNNKRREHAKNYSKLLTGIKHIKIPQEFPERKSAVHLYVVRASKRNELQEYLTAQGITTLVHYPIPLHEQNMFKNMNIKPSDFPNAHMLAQEILSLPIYPEITEKMQKYVVDHIKKFYSA